MAIIKSACSLGLRKHVKLLSNNQNHMQTQSYYQPAWAVPRPHFLRVMYSSFLVTFLSGLQLQFDEAKSNALTWLNLACLCVLPEKTDHKEGSGREGGGVGRE